MSFESSGAVQTALDNGVLGRPYVATYQDVVEYGDAIPPGPDYSQMYFTIEALSAGTIEFIKSGTGLSVILDYSMDDGQTWTTFTSTTAGTQIQVQAGDKVMFRGENTTFTTVNTYNSFSSGSTAQFKVYGNSMSLLYGDGFYAATAFESGASYVFFTLFLDCTTLTDASNLVLPVMDLSSNYQVYHSMFRRCTSLVAAPELPATTLCYEAYGYMFEGCTSLTTAPELPATTLAQRCYGNMFVGCTSLTTAPELPVTTLVHNCYEYMFRGCTSLTESPILPANTSSGVSNPYNYMFSGCTSLNKITCLLTNPKPYRGPTQGWVAGVAASGTFYKDASTTTWPTGNNGIPEGWTVVDYTPPA